MKKTHFIKYVAALIFLMILLSMFACNTDNTEKTDTTAESLEESVAETDSPTSEEGDPSANTEPPTDAESNTEAETEPTAPDDPERNGYTFVGWYVDGEKVTDFGFSISADALQDGVKVKKGKKIKNELWVCTSINIKEAAKRLGYLDAIEKAGGKICCDTCMVVAPIEQMGYEVIGVNSAKAANYVPSMCGLKVIYNDIENLLDFE